VMTKEEITKKMTIFNGNFKPMTKEFSKVFIILWHLIFSLLLH